MLPLFEAFERRGYRLRVTNGVVMGLAWHGILGLGNIEREWDGKDW